MSDAPSRSPRELLRRVRSPRTSASTRLAVAVLAVAITTILVSVLVSTANVIGNTDEQDDVRIRTRATSTATELDAYFTHAARNVAFLADSPSVAELSTAFTEAYRELDGIDPDTLVAERADVAAFYLDVVVPAIEDIRGQAVDPIEFAPGESSAAAYLQAAYLANNPFQGDERRLLTDPQDDSAWTAVHRRAHPALRDLSETFGFDDLMIVDANRQDVVYAVAKDTAFATGLSEGPFSGTSLAALVRRVLADPEGSPVVAADAAVYPPAGDVPRIFLAAPIDDGDDVIAVVVGSLSLDEVTAITTRVWREGRFGETGELYVVGPDQRMRSDARPFLEDPAAYLARIDELGTLDEGDRQHIDALGTTVVFQPVETDAVEAGLAGGADTITDIDYLGREVVTSFVPIGGDTFDWVLVVQQDVAEAAESRSDYVTATLVITVVFVVALTFVAVAWANGFMNPIRTMSAALRGIRAGSDTTTIVVGGVREFRDLARHLDAMVGALAEHRDRVVAALRAKAAVVRTLMPDAAAEQVRLGRRRLTETVPQASVVVVVLDGLDELAPHGDVTRTRDFLHELVDRLDELATLHELERVKLVGDAYHAVAGLSGPQIDHAPRAAAFAAGAVEEVARIAEAGAVDIVARAGVASGAVTAGLVGQSRLVFDVWGEPVDTAFAIAHDADTGQVLLDRSTRERLPAGSAVDEVAGAGGTIRWAFQGFSGAAP